MSYSLELEATASVHTGSSELGAAVASTTTPAGDAQHQHLPDQIVPIRKHFASSSPSPPPFPTLDHDSTTTSPPSLPARATATPLSVSPTDSAAHATRSAPALSINPASAPRRVAASMSPASRYPSFDQWVTFKDASFNFSAQHTGSHAEAAPSRPAHDIPAAPKAAVLHSSRTPALASERVTEDIEVESPQQLYMRAVALQQVCTPSDCFLLEPFFSSHFLFLGYATHPRCCSPLFRCRHGTWHCFIHLTSSAFHPAFAGPCAVAGVAQHLPHGRQRTARRAQCRVSACAG
jgi:hypothetical protein